MKLNEPYWVAILNHYEKKHYFQNGLTIPFLIGARTIVEPSEKLLPIPSLLNEMINHNSPVTVMKCGCIKEFVFALMDNETDLMRNQYQNLYKEYQNLVCTDQSLDTVSTKDELIKFLSTEYESLILAKDYSKYDGKWQDFSPTDVKRLSEIRIERDKNYR